MTFLRKLFILETIKEFNRGMDNYKDEVYRRVHKKVEANIFSEGSKIGLEGKYIAPNMSLEDISPNDRTPEMYVSLINHNRCHLEDVPDELLSNSFLISTFQGEVRDYIKNHPAKFDRQFYKNLITFNYYATTGEDNCFRIMPVEYIDEEMCTLAILNSLDHMKSDWFYAVQERKPEALTEDLWKLGARFYAEEKDGENKFLKMTPEQYKDEEYYLEMCSSICSLYPIKGKIMDTIPKEVITPQFLMKLLSDTLENITTFNEAALETEIAYHENGNEVHERIWQFAIRKWYATVERMKLTPERIAYFKQYYSNDTDQYNGSFRSRYRKFRHPKVNQLKEGEILLPNQYAGTVPENMEREYDADQYLEAIYRSLGIEIVGELTDDTYAVVVPSNLTITKTDDTIQIQNQDSNTTIQLSCYKNLVREIEFANSKQSGIRNKVIVKDGLPKRV